MRKFTDSEEEMRAIQENFVKIYNFDDEEQQDRLIEMLKEKFDDYILKPQREGGANNYYGECILNELNSLSKKDRKNFILMQKIKPLPQCGFLVKKGKLEVAAVVCELGILGSFLAKGNLILNNRTAGYLCRTKKFFENEGGVAAGYAVIDSIMHTK